MLFDPEKYVKEIQYRTNNKVADETLKMPRFKVPSNNLTKLSYDKKIANIVIDVKVKGSNGSFFVLRDRFDWDLTEPYTRPIDFAT